MGFSFWSMNSCEFLLMTSRGMYPVTVVILLLYRVSKRFFIKVKVKLPWVSLYDVAVEIM